jgi:DNA-binding CsgD family transcriptional regulator
MKRVGWVAGDGTATSRCGESRVDAEQASETGTADSASAKCADLSALMPASASYFTDTLLGEDLLVIELPSPCDEWDWLTKAEREIAELVLGGASNREMAEVRGCSVRTVANQLQSVFRKLGVASRAELACRATGAADLPDARVCQSAP